MANLTAYGIQGLDDLQNLRLAEVRTGSLPSLIQQQVAYQNQKMMALTSAWVQPTTLQQERVRLNGAVRMQPVTAKRRAEPVVAGITNTVAYPLKEFEHAWAYDRSAMAKKTAAEFNDDFATGIEADVITQRENLLASILDEVTWTFGDVEGDLSIKPLANGDGDLYHDLTGATTTADNYLFQNAVISDTNPAFPTIREQLRGFLTNRVSDQFPVIAFVAPNLTTAINLLTDLNEPEDPNINYRDTNTARRFSVLFGDDYLGIYDKVHVVEWQSLPSDYIIGWATGAGQFVKMRQEPEVALQGLEFKEVMSQDDLITSYYLRRKFGFGVFNRVAATVMMIDNASYATPTGYLASSDVLV